MRKVFVSNLVSLDGFLAAPDGDLSWFSVGPEFFGYAQALMAEVGAVLFGRVTYEMMRDYWTRPDVVQNDPLVAGPMNALPKYVYSRTLKQAGWGTWDNAHVSADPVGEVRRLKAQPGGDMVIFGSGGLVSALANAGLIDEYRFIVNPAVLGEGIPMFRNLQHRLALRLAAHRMFDGKVMMLTYHPETA